jgi:adenylyltransferase/sulfurtransferase
VLGVLAGTIGVIQAAEAIKEVLGVGESLAGRLLIYDALEMNFRTLRVPKNRECPLCGPHPTLTHLIEEGAAVCAPSSVL